MKASSEVNVSTLDTQDHAKQQQINSPVFYLDISDLILFFHHNTRVTGIQRVAGNIISCHLDSRQEADNIVCCAISPDHDGLIAFKPGQLRILIKYTLSPSVDRDILRTMLADLMRDASSAVPRAGDVYVILGAFWNHDYGLPLLHLRDTGVLTATYIYDLIPISHPQYCVESFQAIVKEKLIEILSLSDFFLTISEYVAVELKELLKSELGVEKLVHAVPLANEILQPADGVEHVISDGLAAAADQPFVLCVCTLEGRKNHVLLYRVWSSLIRKHGAEKVPQLVLVGRWGWAIDDFREMCNKGNFLEGKIVIESDLGDGELSYLYERCMFTVFPSFVEGWGLPVGESLAFGKPCLASNASSIPEVGGDLAVYFNPHDLIGATALLEKAIFDESFLGGLAARIEAEFTPRRSGGASPKTS